MATDAADETDAEIAAATYSADNEVATATDAEDAEVMYAVLIWQLFDVG